MTGGSQNPVGATEEATPVDTSQALADAAKQAASHEALPARAAPEQTKPLPRPDDVPKAPSKGAMSNIRVCDFFFPTLEKRSDAAAEHDRERITKSLADVARRIALT